LTKGLNLVHNAMEVILVGNWHIKQSITFLLLYLRVGLSEIDYTRTIERCGKNHSDGTALAVNVCTENRKIAGMFAVLSAIFIRDSVNRLWAD